MTGREILLLDEPLSNLDANLCEEMRSDMRRLLRGGTASEGMIGFPCIAVPLEVDPRRIARVPGPEAADVPAGHAT